MKDKLESETGNQALQVLPSITLCCQLPAARSSARNATYCKVMQAFDHVKISKHRPARTSMASALWRLFLPSFHWSIHPKSSKMPEIQASPAKFMQQYLPPPTLADRRFRSRPQRPRPGTPSPDATM
jgi:hypothetical protein